MQASQGPRANFSPVRGRNPEAPRPQQPGVPNRQVGNVAAPVLSVLSNVIEAARQRPVTTLVNVAAIPLTIGYFVYHNRLTPQYVPKDPANLDPQFCLDGIRMYHHCQPNPDYPLGLMVTWYLVSAAALVNLVLNLTLPKSR